MSELEKKLIAGICSRSAAETEELAARIGAILPVDTAILAQVRPHLFEGSPARGAFKKLSPVRPSTSIRSTRATDSSST